MTTPGATSAAAALQADLDAIVALERRIRAAQAEQLRLIERAHGYAHAVEGVHEESTPVQREFGTRSFIAELATTLMLPERTAGALAADAGTARRHPATLHALAAGRSASPSSGRSSRPSPGCPPTPQPRSRRPRWTGRRSRPTPPCAVGSAPCGNACTPNRWTPDTAPRRWTGGWCSNPPPTGWPGSASTSTPNAPTPSQTASTSSPTPTPPRLPRAARMARPTRPPDDARTHAQRVLDTAADLLLTGLRTNHDGDPVDDGRGDRGPGAGHRPGAHPARTHRRTRRTRRVRTHPRRHRPTPRRTRPLIPPHPHPPRDRRLPLLQPHHLPRPRRPGPLPPNPRRHLPVPRLRPPRHHLRPRPHHPLQPQRPHQPRQPRPPLPQPPPPQTPHPLAHDPTPQRHHPLDHPHRPTPHHPPRTPLHPTPIVQPHLADARSRQAGTAATTGDDTRPRRFRPMRATRTQHERSPGRGCPAGTHAAVDSTTLDDDLPRAQRPRTRAASSRAAMAASASRLDQSSSSTRPR